MKFLLILLSLAVYNVNSLYFHLYKSQKQCFYDEFYSNIAVMVRFNILDTNFSFLNENEKRVEIRINSVSDKKLVKKFESGKLNGKFSHTIEHSGHYKICVESSDNDLFVQNKKIRFSLVIDTDLDEPEDHSNVVKNKEFEKVNKKVINCMRKADEIVRMQDFQIETEDEFSQSQFTGSKRIVTMTIIQICIITIIGVWQIYSLKKVFKEKAWSPF